MCYSFPRRSLWQHDWTRDSPGAWPSFTWWVKVFGMTSVPAIEFILNPLEIGCVGQDCQYSLQWIIIIACPRMMIWEDSPCWCFILNLMINRKPDSFYSINLTEPGHMVSHIIKIVRFDLSFKCKVSQWHCILVLLLFILHFILLLKLYGLMFG